MGLETYMAGAAIGSAAKSFIDNGINALFGDITARRNYKYNEMAAENADARTRALYTDLYSPEAKMQQLKDAGLSPSLFYDSAGIGGAGQAGAQAAGTAGIAAPNSNGISMTEIANADLMSSQARLNNAQADQIEGTNERGAAEIQKILAEAGLKEAETAYKHCETEQKNLEVYIMSKTKNFEISKAEHISEQAAWSAMQTMYLAMREKTNLQFDLDTYEERAKNIELINKQRVTDIVQKTWQNKLAQAEIQKINAEIIKWSQEIEIQYKNVAISAYNAKSQREYYNNINDFWDAQIKNLEDRLQFDKSKWSDEKKLLWTKTISTIYNDMCSSGVKLIDAILPL